MILRARTTNAMAIFLSSAGMLLLVLVRLRVAPLLVAGYGMVLLCAGPFLLLAYYGAASGVESGWMDKNLDLRQLVVGVVVPATVVMVLSAILNNWRVLGVSGFFGEFFLAVAAARGGWLQDPRIEQRRKRPRVPR